MNQAASTARDAKDTAVSKATAGDAPNWLNAAAKAGYGARGFVYLVIGAMALLKAFGAGGQTGGSTDALGRVLQAPAGIAILWALAIGLVGYALWRALQAILDADKHGNDTKGLAIRAGLLVSAVTHIILAGYAGHIAYTQTQSASGSGSGSSGGESTVGAIMAWPGGRIIVALIGVAIIGAGVAHALKAHKEKYEKRFKINPATMKKLEPICKFGLYARSVVFAIIGGMFIYAAIDQDPQNAGGLQAVLDATAQRSFGMVLLGIMAAGLLAFGLYSIFEAIFRRIDNPWK